MLINCDGVASSSSWSEHDCQRFATSFIAFSRDFFCCSQVLARFRKISLTTDVFRVAVYGLELKEPDLLPVWDGVVDDSLDPTEINLKSKT